MLEKIRYPLEIFSITLHGTVFAILNLIIAKKVFYMQIILRALMVVPCIMYASYNPFFNETQTPQAAQPQKKAAQTTVVRQAQKAIPERKTLEMTYFGFVESSKGKFALVKLGDKNIIISQNDSLYLDERILKVEKITSNYILLQDRYLRAQTVYFSSDAQRQQP